VQHLEAIAYLVLHFMVLLSLSIRTAVVFSLLGGKTNLDFRFIFVVTPCMLSYSIIIPTITHI